MNVPVNVYVNSIGVLGRGMPDWPTAREVLAGRKAWAATDPMPRAAGDILPAGERRRSSAVIRLAVQVAQQALENAGARPEAMALVFASSNGDTDTIHHICEAVAAPEREISPTRFHNSVHNAPAGYWSIATGCRQPATSISRWDDTFAAGLLEAAVQVSVEKLPVLLAAYDIPFPSPLSAVRPAEAPFAAALVLDHRPGAATLAELVVTVAEGPAERLTTMRDPGLESLRNDIASARSLPVLAALAAGHSGRVVLGYGEDGHLLVDVRPWD